MPEQIDGRLALTPIQQELFKALADKRADIAMSYRAAIVLLNDDAIPDRLPLAAHALRELMEKLPNETMAVEMGADLNTKVNELRRPWDEALAEDAAHGGAPWSNGIGAALRAFLVAVREFFEGRDAIVAGRRQQAAEFLKP